MRTRAGSRGIQRERLQQPVLRRVGVRMDGEGRDTNVKVYGKPAPLVSLSVELVGRTEPSFILTAPRAALLCLLRCQRPHRGHTSYCANRDHTGRSPMSPAAVICQTCGQGMAHSSRHDSPPHLRIAPGRRPGRVSGSHGFQRASCFQPTSRGGWVVSSKGATSEDAGLLVM